jgi:hypothetical protein
MLHSHRSAFVICDRFVLPHDNALMEHPLDVHGSLIRVDSAKENIHILKTPSLRLLDEEENPNTHANAENPKHEECTPFDVVYCVGCHLRDYKIYKNQYIATALRFGSGALTE